MMKFLRDESGSSVAEYAFLVAIIGTTLAAAAGSFGEAMAAALGDAGAAIDEAALG